MPPPPPSAVQLDLLQQLEDDGVLTPEAARAARMCYVTDAVPAAPSAASRAASLLTLSNVAKALGVTALLLALATFIALLAPWLSRAPIEVYQAPMLAVAAAATLRPALVWRAQAPYVALLAAASTYIITLWILFSHTAVVRWLDRLDAAGWDTVSLIAAPSLAFFAATAWLHRSPTLAVAAAVCFTWMLLGEEENLTPALWLAVAGHLAAVAAFIAVKARGTHPRAVYLCTYAVEYYCTAVLAFILWFGCMGDSAASAAGFTAAFVAAAAAAAFVHYHLNIRTPASVFACAAVFVLIAWLGRLSETVGTVATLVLCGAALFGAGLLLDRHRRLLVFEAPQDPDGPGGGAAAGGPAAVAMPMIAEEADRVPLRGSDEAC